MATVVRRKNVALPLSHGDIPRFTPSEPKTLPPTSREFANKALATLGYEVMAERLGTDAPVTLAGILAKLGIEALNEKAVIEYKASKTRPDKKQPRLKKADKNSDAMMDEEDSDDETMEPSRDDRPYRWFTTTIRDYSQPIPERAIAKAIQIKETEPRVEIILHHLARERRSISKDPFMEVRFQQENFFIEVWDEPNFSNELTPEDTERANLREQPPKA